MWKSHANIRDLLLNNVTHPNVMANVLLLWWHECRDVRAPPMVNMFQNQRRLAFVYGARIIVSGTAALRII